MTGARKRVDEYNIKEDGTYSITGELIEYKDGYQFSFVRPEAFEQLDDDKWDILTEYIIKQTGSIEHIGVYCHNAETSFWTSDREQALYYAEMFNQESVWNWKAKFKGEPIEKVYIVNEHYDESREVDYDRIIKTILRDTETV